MEIILKYFNNLSKKKIYQFSKLKNLYKFWNKKINLLSRRTSFNNEFYKKHVLYSLGISKVINFYYKTRILDLGTGGGFPGIPLAIFFNKVNFLLIDSIKKKIQIVNKIIFKLKLKNVKTRCIRAENINEKFDFIIGRGVKNISCFLKLVKNKIYTKSNYNNIYNGILYLKGGNLNKELNNISIYTEYSLSNYFKDSYFKTKKIIHIPFLN